MISRSTDRGPSATPPASPATCPDCAVEAGVLSGMVGAAPCGLRERRRTGTWPGAWAVDPCGVLTCSDFTHAFADDPDDRLC